MGPNPESLVLDSWLALKGGADGVDDALDGTILLTPIASKIIQDHAECDEAIASCLEITGEGIHAVQVSRFYPELSLCGGREAPFRIVINSPDLERRDELRTQVEVFPEPEEQEVDLLRAEPIARREPRSVGERVIFGRDSELALHEMPRHLEAFFCGAGRTIPLRPHGFQDLLRDEVVAELIEAIDDKPEGLRFEREERIR